MIKAGSATYSGYPFDVGIAVVETDAAGKAQATWSSGQPGTDTVEAWADTNRDDQRNGVEPFDTATKLWERIDQAASVSLTRDSRVVTEPGVQRCFTATLQQANGDPAANWTVQFAVAGPNFGNTGTGARISNGAGEAPFCYTATAPGTDTVSAFADTDGDGTPDAGEPEDSIEQVWLAGPPSDISVTPASATLPANTLHTLTARVTDAGQPMPNIEVVFKVTGRNSGQGTAITNSNGDAQFPYTGSFTGIDTVEVFPNTDDDDVKDLSEPSDTATVEWTNDPPTSLVLLPESDSRATGTQHCVTATVKDALDRAQGNRLVRFAVTGTHTTGDSVNTAPDGRARYCYTGNQVGHDSIDAYADTDRDATQDPERAGRHRQP